MTPAVSADGEGKAPPRSLIRRFGPALLIAAICATALPALYHLAQGLDYQATVDQIRAFGWSLISLAILLSFGSFAALIGYDHSALRYVGRRVPAKIVALASFCGYALGNVLGIGALTGGSVRYRIYRAAGVATADIIRIAIFCSVAFGVGVTTVSGFSALLYPDSLASFAGWTPAVTRFAALSILALGFGACFLAWRRHKPLQVGALALDLPSPSLAAQQLLFSAAELALAAAALYVLLPSTDLPFLSFLAIYGAATVAGITSHVPGGIGVFEAVILFALKDKAPPEAVAAALFGYRVAYSLLPMVFAALLLAAYEVHRLRRKPYLAGLMRMSWTT
jgi:phosphatidylglycerol lysyltransferase